VQASLVTSSWAIGGTNKSDASNNLVRPVRAFTPCWAATRCLSLATTSKPIDAGSYVINPETLTLSSGDLANYVSIKYETTTVTINKVAQTVQQGVIYNSAYPDVFTLLALSGSGTGASSYSIVSGGTASGCSADYKKFLSTSVGTCNIQIVRLGDRNYLSDTSTSYLYFMAFITSQPTPVTGGGPGIALSGSTSVTLDPNAAPTISAVTFVPLYCSMGMCTPDHWEISGAGFGAMGNTNTIVKFWRNKIVLWEDIAYTTNYVVNDNLIRIQYVPAGATTGKITVTTANGIAVSPDNWIAP
jgi:hypothetical protein